VGTVSTKSAASDRKQRSGGPRSQTVKSRLWHYWVALGVSLYIQKAFKGRSSSLYNRLDMSQRKRNSLYIVRTGFDRSIQSNIADIVQFLSTSIIVIDRNDCLGSKTTQKINTSGPMPDSLINEANSKVSDNRKEI
jgi:hypothetical protein